VAQALPLRFKLHLWFAARLLPAWIAFRGLENILRNATPARPVAPYLGLSPEDVAAAVRETVARSWLMRDRRCLRRTLLAFRFLRLAGHEAVIHFAVSPPDNAARLRAHCWVTLDGVCLLDQPAKDMVALVGWDGALRAAIVDG